jgi:hypothetical protein
VRLAVELTLLNEVAEVSAAALLFLPQGDKSMLGRKVMLDPGLCLVYGDMEVARYGQALLDLVEGRCQGAQLAPGSLDQVAVLPLVFALNGGFNVVWLTSRRFGQILQARAASVTHNFDACAAVRVSVVGGQRIVTRMSRPGPES